MSDSSSRDLIPVSRIVTEKKKFPIRDVTLTCASKKTYVEKFDARTTGNARYRARMMVRTGGGAGGIWPVGILADTIRVVLSYASGS